jgi:hypothetical protein
MASCRLQPLLLASDPAGIRGQSDSYSVRRVSEVERSTYALQSRLPAAALINATAGRGRSSPSCFRPSRRRLARKTRGARDRRALAGCPETFRAVSVVRYSAEQLRPRGPSAALLCSAASVVRPYGRRVLMRCLAPIHRDRPSLTRLGRCFTCSLLFLITQADLC